MPRQNRVAICLPLRTNGVILYLNIHRLGQHCRVHHQSRFVRACFLINWNLRPCVYNYHVLNIISGILRSLLHFHHELQSYENSIYLSKEGKTSKLSFHIFQLVNEKTETRTKPTSKISRSYTYICSRGRPFDGRCGYSAKNQNKVIKNGKTNK